jgi:hypothetical protein
MPSSRSLYLETFRLTLFSALGLIPFTACGGETTDPGGGSGAGGLSAGTSGDGSGGTTATGGAASGGAPSMGGTVAAGGVAVTGGRAATGGRTSAGGSAAGGPATGGATTGGAAAGGVATGGTSSGGKVSMGGAGAAPFACSNPKPVAGDPSGNLVQCGGGWKHRPHANECPSSAPRADPIPPSSNPELDECTNDSECTAKPYGYCNGPNSTELALPVNGCFYGCRLDSDCPNGALCECGTPVGTCIAATCRVDEDCGPGLLCGSYVSDPGCDFPAYACQLTSDVCAVNTDCPDGESCTILERGGGRVCSIASCAIGRPFIVDGRLRMAAPVPRRDWCANDIALDALALSAPLRQRLADSWSHAACLEHASVAAFARFTLELLAFGAPAELVSLAGRAMADETRHAELTFALASRYAGRALGPASLAVGDALANLELESSAISAFLEGCIGETVAALEAAEALATTTDSAVRDVLAEIAPDEARHAELAWRFLKWALATSLHKVSLGERLLASLVSEERAARSAVSQSFSSEPLGPELRQQGVLPEAQRRGLRSQALRDVVRPCLEALLREVAKNETFALTSGPDGLLRLDHENHPLS